MPADALAKRSSNAVTLLRVMRGGVYRIFAGQDELKKRIRGQAAQSWAVVR